MCIEFMKIKNLFFSVLITIGSGSNSLCAELVIPENIQKIIDEAILDEGDNFNESADDLLQIVNFFDENKELLMNELTEIFPDSQRQIWFLKAYSLRRSSRDYLDLIKILIAKAEIEKVNLEVIDSIVFGHGMFGFLEVNYDNEEVIESLDKIKKLLKNDPKASIYIEKILSGSEKQRAINAVRYYEYLPPQELTKK